MRRTAHGSAAAAGWRRPWVLVLAMAAGSMLVACGQAEPGVAASIDGTVLSVDEVHEVSVQFFEDYPEALSQVDKAELNSVTIENFLRVRIVDNMGDAYDVQPTPTELQTYIDDNFGGLEAVTPQMSGVGVPSSRTDL